MRRTSSGSRSSLFLIELIFSLLVFALVSSVCVRFFAAAWKSRTSAREWNHMQELTVNTAEILEAGNGSAEDFRILFPEGRYSASGIDVCFDSHWNVCTEEDAAYFLHLQLLPDTWSRGMELTFTKGNGEILYHQEIRYPGVPDSKGGAGE